MADEVDAEPALRLDDAAVGDELDEIGGLVLVEVVRVDERELDCSSGDALLEVARR